MTGTTDEPTAPSTDAAPADAPGGDPFAFVGAASSAELRGVAVDDLLADDDGLMATVVEEVRAHRAERRRAAG